MLSKLLKSRRVAAKLPAIPEGQRVYAIGDVHGCADLLDNLLEQIDFDDKQREPADTTIVLLGDLVDRGPDSAAVVERLRVSASEHRNLRFLMGNHEEIFLGALAGEEKSVRLFCRIGGRETLISYGLSPQEYEQLGYDEVVTRLRALVPESHRVFLAGFEDVIVIGDYAFVHAGIHPARPLAEQSQNDLRWIRHAFLDFRGELEKHVVHGHTIAPDVDRAANRTGIDTGAYASGRLTAIGLQGEAFWSLGT